MDLAQTTAEKPSRNRLHLDADQKVFFVSDLHLGDGTRSDSFEGKDALLIEFIQHVRDQGGHLVIAGDAIDFDQAWFMSRVLKAHAPLFSELASLANTHGVTYIWGNHDSDISFFKDLLRFDVCSSLQIGDEVIVRHGYEYDPYIGPSLEQSHNSARIHHLAERLLGAWVRLPIQNHYNPTVRCFLWVIHKLVLGYRFLGWLGFSEFYKRCHGVDKYWVQAELGDPQGIFDGIRSAIHNGPYKWIVTGHSHLPGLVEVAPDRWYVNTGSWTFKSTQYAFWDGEALSVHDWRAKRTYDDRLYRPLMDREYKHMDFMAWWRENYMGWLRFRVGEEGRPAFIETQPQEDQT